MAHRCLLFPDEQRYRASEKPEYWNLSHKHMDMGLKYMLDILYKIPEVTAIEYAEIGRASCRERV